MSGPTILLVMVVEDHDDTRFLLKTMLKMMGYRVVEAGDGLEAVRLSTLERPDLILMDLNLPILDGYEATERILSQPETKHIPILAVSAQCTPDKRDRAFAAGCIDCVEKPFNFDQLSQVMQRVFSRNM
jgi:two-component system cell cycle response regulator DivK